MEFGPVDLDAAVGAILAHSQRLSDGVIKKGTVLDASHIERLRKDGLDQVIVARLDRDDVVEDAAAARVAIAIAGEGVRVDDAFTGRANVFADTDGIFLVEPDALNALNAVDEAITIATLPSFSRVAAGQMVATVKIIPYAVSGASVGLVERNAAENAAACSVAPFARLQAALIATRTLGDKDKVIEKRRAAVLQRVRALGGRLISDATCDHAIDPLTAAISGALDEGPDVLLVFGAAAISDRNDVIPAALAKAGGEIVHMGMPVDPGNLLMLGRLGETSVVGVPSCAASPKLNGFDWVLERLFANIPVGGADIMQMGVGGLLGEIPSRIQPRARSKSPKKAEPTVAALVLAAGAVSRVSDRFRLVEPFEGAPMIRRVCMTALESRAGEVIVVTGQGADDVERALEGLDVRIVHNPDHAAGLSTSLRAGVNALSDDVDAAVVMLGDMPMVQAGTIDRIIDANTEADGRSICVPVSGGKRGNPVLWPAGFFETLTQLAGDQGARSVIASNPESVIHVDVDDAGVLLDYDAAAALRGLAKN